MKPETLLHYWNIDPHSTTIKQVQTGLLNQTYIVRTETEIFILQKLHPAVSLPGCTNNYFAVTTFLSDQNIVTQTVKPTTQGKLILSIDDQNWRLLYGVEGSVFTTTPSAYIAQEAGKLLGTFHRQLTNFANTLEPTLPMFQYRTVLQKLQTHADNLLKDSNAQVRNTCTLLLSELPQLLLPDTLPQQIIHTDPKISNFLFDNNGNGICMIDLDTIQISSPLYDIGDCVRSICSQEEDDPNNTFNVEHYQAILKGYAQKNTLTPNETSLIPQTCKLVMLALAARFLNDYIDDNYFGWDQSRYETRKGHNLARTLGQIALYTSFSKIK